MCPRLTYIEKAFPRVSARVFAFVRVVVVDGVAVRAYGACVCVLVMYGWHLERVGVRFLWCGFDLYEACLCYFVYENVVYFDVLVVQDVSAFFHE